jgi:hypothetical protein
MGESGEGGEHNSRVKCHMQFSFYGS